MIDPVAAVGVASAAITFLDFSWTLVKLSIEVYKLQSGASADKLHIDKLIRTLRGASDRLSSDIKHGKSKYGNVMKAIAKDSIDLAQKLLQVLKKLGGHTKKQAFWRNVQVQWRISRKSSLIEKIAGHEDLTSTLKKTEAEDDHMKRSDTKNANGDQESAVTQFLFAISAMLRQSKALPSYVGTYCILVKHLS
ncbi:hypothetical protein SCUP234_10808 [Seiridium cupressi]